MDSSLLFSLQQKCSGAGSSLHLVEHMHREKNLCSIFYFGCVLFFTNVPTGTLPIIGVYEMIFNTYLI